MMLCFGSVFCALSLLLLFCAFCFLFLESVVAHNLDIARCVCFCSLFCVLVFFVPAPCFCVLQMFWLFYCVCFVLCFGFYSLCLVLVVVFGVLLIPRILCSLSLLLFMVCVHVLCSSFWFSSFVLVLCS